MNLSARHAASLAALFLLVTVVTQGTYVMLSNAGVEPNRMVIWTLEALAFLGITICALVALARGSGSLPAWAAIATSGLLNTVQVGMGLAMFGPVSDAGEAMAPAFKAILAGAFFFYFAGKFLFGLAAILMGIGMVSAQRASLKVVGGLAALAGAAAMVVNLLGMAKGMEFTFPAGATGTVATLLLAICLLITARRDSV